MKILFTCGGTGGHINPAIAAAKMVKTRRKECEILFVGAESGMEVGLVTNEGFKIETIKISSFKRSLKPIDVAHNFKTAANMLGSLRQAGGILRSFKPDAVVGTGGYASFPIVYKASRMGIKTAIHESNVSPGLTTRMLAGRVDRIMVSFEESAAKYKNPEKVVVTGTPVREGFVFLKKRDARAALGLDDKPLIVSYWGSLGAREMNKKIAEFMKLESVDKLFNHIHATGSYGWRWMPEYVENLGVKLEENPQIDMREYVFDMPTVMAAADLVICRAGASTISELTALAIPSIMVPSPNVAENHQEKNARALEKTGAAVVITEAQCTGESLYKKAAELLKDKEALERMTAALSAVSVLDATQRIYSTIMELIGSP